MKLSHRILRFAAVGSACFILQYCLMKIFSGLMPLYFAEVIGFMFSAQANFALSQIFTWADRKHAIDYLMRWVKFNVSSLASVLIVNATVFWLLTSLGSWMWLSLLSANAASTAFTFVMNHFVVFRNKPLAGQDVAPTGEAPTPVSSVSLFMPAHNEAENLPNVIRLAHNYFDDAGIAVRSVIIVDDGSTDNTLAVIDDIQSTLPVTVVSHEVNKGYGAALRSGFQAALSTGHDWIAFCDSDGQFNPADLALLFDAAQRDRAQVALGYRAHRADNWRRRTAGRTWHTLSQAFLGFRATDVDCGFKLFRREALLSVMPKLRSDYATISPELLARLHHAGHSFAEVAVPHYPRDFGRQSGMNIRVMVGSFAGLYPVRQEIFAEVQR
jgi:putative flippase GtrA